MLNNKNSHLSDDPCDSSSMRDPFSGFKKKSSLKQSSHRANNKKVSFNIQNLPSIEEEKEGENDEVYEAEYEEDYKDEKKEKYEKEKENKNDKENEDEKNPPEDQKATIYYSAREFVDDPYTTPKRKHENKEEIIEEIAKAIGMNPESSKNQSHPDTHPKKKVTFQSSEEIASCPSIVPPSPISKQPVTTNGNLFLANDKKDDYYKIFT